MSEDIGVNAAWNSRLEEYFSALGERSHCLHWLHSKSEALYSARRAWIDLPVIVLSALIGFCSVGSTTLFTDQRFASISLGVVSLAVSILNTSGSYYNFAKRAEGHRISAIEYAKLYRLLLVEMSLPRGDRLTPGELLKQTKDANDRLAEVSPLLSPAVIREFKAKFEDNDKYKDVAKPEVTNGLEAIIVFDEARERRLKTTLSPLHSPQEEEAGTGLKIDAPQTLTP